MCPRDELNRKLKMMDFQLFKKIINETKEYTKFVWLHGFGESLIHPQIDDFIKYCKKNHMKTGLSTNCTLINENMSRKLLNTRLDHIIFALDGATKETYEKIRLRADYKEVTNNVNMFLKMKEEMRLKKPRVTVQAIEMSKNEAEIELFKKQWYNKNVDEILIRLVSTYADQIGGIKELSKQQQVLATRKRYPCILLWKSVVVFADGSVVPCCMDFNGKIILGNVKEKSLKEIWNDKKMLELRRKHVNGNYAGSICSNCTIWDGSPYNPLFPMDAHFIRKLAKSVIVGLKRNKIHVDTRA